jgi:hypothetical protein
MKLKFFYYDNEMLVSNQLKMFQKLVHHGVKAAFSIMTTIFKVIYHETITVQGGFLSIISN